MGAPDEVIEAAEQRLQAAKDATEVYGVWADNWDTWLLYLTVQTQWTYLPIQTANHIELRRISLHYPGIESHFRLARLPRADWPARWADLQLIERAVLAADAETTSPTS